MLENALLACPDTHWHGQIWPADSDLPPEASAFWYVIYHTLFWLDLYLAGSVEGFVPPAPFTLDELDPAGIVPERPYSKEELHAYLRSLRQKCQTTISELTDGQARREVNFSWNRGRPISFLSLLLDTMRHVQEHAAQLNLFLGQNNITVANWVAQAKADENSK
jgi:hypothetical protein